MEGKEDINKAMYLDEQDFLAKFLFNPTIKDSADYSHIDKNLSVTRLDSRRHEPEQARSILRALHILNNNKYFKDIIVDTPTGDYQTVSIVQYSCPNCGNVRYSEHEISEGVQCCNSFVTPEKVEKTVPITKKSLERASLYPRTYHNLKAIFYAFTTTSMARDGHLMRSATTTNIAKSESVEDRTKVRGNPFFGFKKNNYRE